MHYPAKSLTHSIFQSQTFKKIARIETEDVYDVTKQTNFNTLYRFFRWTVAMEVKLKCVQATDIFSVESINEILLQTMCCHFPSRL